MEVQEHSGALRSRGARVVAVAQGTGDEAAQHGLGVAPDVECLGDPDKRLYRLFGFRRDGWWNVTARPFFEEPGLALARIRRASLKGSLMPHSDVLQLGGVVLIDREGVIRYLHRAAKTDDYPPSPELIARLDELARSRSGEAGLG